MIDFKKKLEEKTATMTPEQRHFSEEYNKLKNENIFYEAEIVIEKGNGSEETLYPKVLRDVYVEFENGERKIVVSKHLKLDFGGFWSYYFDNHFIDRVSDDLMNNPHKDFCLDTGQDIIVENHKMYLLIKCAKDTLVEQGIDMVDDEVRDRK